MKSIKKEGGGIKFGMGFELDKKGGRLGMKT
jgi:hypothetical protein